MKKILAILLLLAVGFAGNAQNAPVRTIFASGGNYGKPFIKYVMALTKKKNPRICFMPTPSGDSQVAIATWYQNCEDLEMQPFVQSMYISSYRQNQSFEDVLLSMDAIIVGGGSTLNAIAEWKAQGIDTILRKAYNKGIVLGGGSAGSLCWFQGGTTDSRPQALSICMGLGFLPYSNCPHWLKEQARRPLYTNALITGKLNGGYACDDSAALLFENEKYVKSVAIDKSFKTYFISVEKGKIVEKYLPVTEIIN
ncbi:peptidase E [Mucilaginibacter sp.]|uniref:Type 1 glutamine amidotransferase-like domain-containing protein n=1 Tax=Mucilaginibacter sp. TaxID=1882438 RepID=UPI00260D3B5D|nr:peptidase E [Mucilaginibacter sp.]MDB5031867.1 Peptidase [Mucilaginibacter sp.]